MGIQVFGITIGSGVSAPQRERISGLEASPMPATPDDALHELYGRIRDVREEALNLLRSIEAVLEKGKLADDVARSREVFTAFHQTAAIWQANSGPVIQVLFVRVRRVLDAHPRVYDAAGDQVTRVQNWWERVDIQWRDLPPVEAGTTATKDLADEILRECAQVKPVIETLIYEAAFLTIPARAMEHLKATRVGEPLDFHATFEDELPDRDQRVRLLKYLARHPDPIDGWVDVENGVIIRFADTAGRRSSYFRLAATVLLGLLVATLLADVKPWVADWPFEASQRAALVVTYVAMLVGALAHVLIDGVKQAREQPKGTFMAVGSWLLWVHVRETSILGGIATFFVAYLGTVFTSAAMLDGKIVWMTALMIGYSADSIAGLYLKRFDVFRSKLTEGAERAARGPAASTG